MLRASVYCPTFLSFQTVRLASKYVEKFSSQMHLKLSFTDVLGGDVGVAITSCIFLTGALQYGMRQSAEAENLMTSVERVMEYGDLKSEADLKSDQKIDDQDLFDQGKVKFEKVSLRYDQETKLILKNISFETEAHEKIGIVGRTGAGKSSLIAGKIF